QQTSFPSNGANDVFFNDSLEGFISRSNALYKTTDGGINWSLIPNVTNFSYGRFSNIAYKNLFLAGGIRTYQSTDSGENWNEVIGLRNQFVECIKLLEINNGYAVGRMGLIIRLTDSVVNVETERINQPNKYILFQNYPNPFNNSTSISFSLPENTRVRLTIYDSLGRQVKRIADNEFESGFHTINFDTDGLASGIYLYKIEGGGFSEAKKMILLK
ncbi:MAG: T9SS type A sorting domain-containing protein, partial [Sediminibacterium sp.]